MVECDAILEEAYRDAETFFDFPDRVYSADQRRQIMRLAWTIAQKRGWKPNKKDTHHAD